ncbi:MAG: hypothetical protein IKI93_19295 [Clostridia bacterium]|nr:hypothetical protein [Clostridia bacterium]
MLNIMQEAAVRNMTKQPNRIERMVFMKLSRKLISMLLIAMFLVTSITATDVITPSLTPNQIINPTIQPRTNHCYFEVNNVSGYWVERWYSNVLDEAYFVPDGNGENMISGENLISTAADCGAHPHEGSLSYVTNIAPGSSKVRVDDLGSLNNLDWDNAILVIDNPPPEVELAAFPNYYYWVYDDSTATYYGDLICIFN